jgi:hypothetical protein
MLPGIATAAEPTWRWTAPIVLEQPAAFVVLPLPASTYARSERPDLADLRLLDAQGRRVPFAFLPPAAQPVPLTRPAALYPLPGQRDADGDWASPLTVQVHRGEVRVHPATTTAKRAGSAVLPGWLVDLGPREADTPRALALRFAWSGPATFTAPYALQTSDDLRDWHPAAGGQLMALQSATGPLRQAEAPRPTGSGRFVRLLWSDPASAPALTEARPVFAVDEAPSADPPVTLTITPATPPADASRGAVCFDLGGPLPVSRLDVDPGPPPRVLPLRIEGREAAGRPWRAVAQGVSYRLARDGRTIASPPLAATVALRHLCVVPDERAAAPDGALKLTLQVHLPRLVFAQQGTPPFTLRAGAADAPPGALPASTLVPMLEAQRPQFGRATLGDWAEDAAAVQARAAGQRQAAWRRWALWAVLLGGVALLGAMVWRLARAPRR